MKSNKLMQALLSTAMCAAILFSNAAAVFAAEVPPLPRKEGENPLAEQSPVNLLRQPGAASSYQYGEDALYNMSNLDLLGSDASSLDLDCQKLTDGVKSSAGSIDFDSVVNFYSNSAFNNAENGAKFSNQNTVDFDLGQPKTIVEVNAYSSAGLTGRYAGSLGHIGKYSVYVSADKNQWTCVLDGKNCGEDISEQTGAYVARYAVSADKVPGHPDATGIYAQYVRILFETNALWSNYSFLTAEEVEILGQDGKAQGAFEPAGEQESPAAENLARTASYTYSPSTEEYMLTAENDLAYSSDADCKKMNDGVRGDATGADMTNWTVFEPIPWMNPDNASNYNNDPLCAIFDLGAQKFITGVSTASLVTQQIKQSANLQIYVSNDKLDWFEVSKKNGYDQQEPVNGVVELSWDAATDKVKDHADATAVYARYVKVVFSSVSPDAPSQQVALDEIEILGSSDRMEGAYEPKAEEITGDTDPHYPDNLAYRKSYEVLNASAAGDSSYPDPKKTKLTDGVEATADYLDAPWTAYSDGAYREFVIDLGEICSVSEVEFNNLSNDGIAAKMPGSVDVSFSKDNASWSTLKNAFLIPERPTEVAKVLYNWKAADDPYVPKADGQATAKVEARYVKLHVPMQNWCFIDEIRVLGEKGVTDDAVSLPIDGEIVKTYMQKGPHTAGIGNLVLLYNGYYEDGSGNWTAENCMPYLVHEDLKTGELDTMFDGVLLLALRTEGGEHTFQGPSSAAEAATVDDFIWYLEKTLGKNGDVAQLNQAAKMAGEKLGDPDYKLKVVLNIPGTSEKQVDFGALPGTTKSLSFSPDINPDGYMDDQVAAINWYNQELLRMWDEGSFEYLELAGIYLVEEGISKMTPVLQSVADFAHGNDLKYFWIPYMNAPGYSQWKRWGFDAVAYQPNYMFSSDSTTERLQNAAQAAIEYGMGIELELAGLNEAGVISPDRFNRYMDYLEAGVDYGFDGDKAYKAYYQDTCALLYAANSNTPKVRYIYDATYQFIKGTYEKGYLQYLSEETITLNDVSDIGTALEAIAKKLEAASEQEEIQYLEGQKAKLEKLRDYIMAIREDIAQLVASFEGVTADNITEEQKIELKEVVARIQNYLSGQNLTSAQRSTLTKKLQQLYALDESAFKQYTITIAKMTNGRIEADQQKAIEGTTVTLTVTPDSNYKLKEGSLLVNGKAISGTSFVMPAEDVTITAEFVSTVVSPVPTPTPTPTPAPSAPNTAQVPNQPAPTPASTSKPSTITAMPQTGDTSNPTLYVVLLVASLLGLAVVFVCKKRNDK